MNSAIVNTHTRYEVPVRDAGKLIAIANILEAKDKYTEGHAQRVAIYSERLAIRVGLPEKDVKNIGIGGMLHDIGKIGLSDRIFRNEDVNLSESMFEEIRQHPGIGVSILKYLGFDNPILDYVYCHHERVDGTGYPCGLKEDEIPLGARIISVADCFDAITTDRPYQKGKSRYEAFAILKKVSGKALSTDIVEAFFEEIEENGMFKRRRLQSSYIHP